MISAVLFCQPGYAGCSAESMDDYASVYSIVDGDTIRLGNQKLVRLIGINTPEIDYDGDVSEPLAHTAKQFLISQLGTRRRIGLVYEQESQDRHGRRLAHVFVVEDGVYRNVQQRLLENGLAFWVAIPPNTHYLDCYRSAESTAKLQGIGIWREVYFQPRQATDEHNLIAGFQLLQGKIVSTYKSKNAFWLKFNDTVALRIADKDIHNFKVSALEALKGKTVTARGWLYKHKNRLTMQIRHPASIELPPQAAS